MPTFQPNVPIRLQDSDVEVDAGGTGLGAGAHRFSLTVTDDSGNESSPAVIDVIIRDDKRPTAVLDLRDADGRRIDPVVAAGQNFILSGARSADLPPGRIVSYQFTLLDD
jgi:hypothetical protein